MLANPMPYQPIQNYGVIGDMRTAALVGLDGSIDWFCYPHFDSPSVFGALLDDTKGGRFRICVLGAAHTTKQFYFPDTNVLITRFLSPDGVAEITDFMPGCVASARARDIVLVRIVRAVRGATPFRAECRPAFDYARAAHTMTPARGGIRFESAAHHLGLASSVPLAIVENGAVAEFTLNEGQSAVFALRRIEPNTDEDLTMPAAAANELFDLTVEHWRHWLSQCTYQGRWREMVYRSALALKLLTFEPTGAIVAAPTCSLPETVGGVRNWDYRYTWIRDAAFTLYGLLRIGFTDEAAAFMRWLDARCHELDPDGSLQIVYGIDGRHDLRETTLDHLEGYKGSRPVRIGNEAYGQLQLDIYGELMDSVYLYNKYGAPISYDSWTHLRRLINWLCDNWGQKDEGIWEVRSGRQHYVYSKLMCWVAVDRALRLADKRSFPADRARWLDVRDKIYEGIMAQGWSEKRRAFVQHYGSESLDASNLIMPLVFFLSPTDPRMLDTIAAIHRAPAAGGLVSDSLVYRYDSEAARDGLTGREGTFNMCTFWLVEAMTRAGVADRGYLEEARTLFERMTGYANHVGLFAEETGYSGEALGNFPQAFTHLALISAAFNLDRALGKRK